MHTVAYRIQGAAVGMEKRAGRETGDNNRMDERMYFCLVTVVAVVTACLSVSVVCRLSPVYSELTGYYRIMIDWAADAGGSKSSNLNPGLASSY